MSTLDADRFVVDSRQADSKATTLRWAAQLSVVLITIGLIVATFYSTRKPDVQDQDFGAYYRAGKAVLAGRSPYVLESHGNLGAYMYAPAFAELLFRWFAMLPYQWAARVFLAINWVATVAVVQLCLRLTTEPGRDRFWIGLIAFVPTGTYLWANLHNGQVGTLLLLACLLWIHLTLTGRSFLGGMVLSLAIGLKLYPALLIPYLLLRQDWRAIAGVIVGLLLLFAVPAIFIPAGDVGPLHGQWLRFCVATQTADQTIRTGNQSLLGALARLPFVSDGNQKHWSAEHLAMLCRIYPLIVLALTGILYGWLICVGKRRPTAPNHQLLSDLALLLLWMTIASPRAWTFNFATEVFAACLLAKAISDHRPHAWIGVVALIGVLIALTFPTNKFNFSSAWSLSAYFMQNKHFDALVLLGFALAITRLAPHRNSKMPVENASACPAVPRSDPSLSVDAALFAVCD